MFSKKIIQLSTRYCANKIIKRKYTTNYLRNNQYVRIIINNNNVGNINNNYTNKFFSSTSKNDDDDTTSNLKYNTNDEDNKASDGDDNAKEETKADGSSNSSNSEDDDKHLKKISELEEEVKDMKDKYMRSLAEVDNVRNIAKRDVQNATTYASQKFAKALLDTADNLTRALEHVPQDELETNEVLKNFHEGVVMTETNLQKTFVNHGIVKFGEIGDEFDPAIHEAMFQIPDPDATPDTIGQLLSCGYKFKDRVLRPAQVGTYK